MPAAKPNTAVVRLKFRVPKGVSAAKARALIANHIYGPLYLDMEESSTFGTGEIKFTVSGASIAKPAAKSKRPRTCL